MLRFSVCLLTVACVLTPARNLAAQFPLGPGNHGPRQVVDSAINEYICKAVVEHATTSAWFPTNSGGNAVELVSARYQGDLVFVFSRVYYCTRTPPFFKTQNRVAEVQYSMVQTRFRRAVYEIWFCETQPRIYHYYDLGRIRTKINDELGRFDRIAGDMVFPGPYPRGPSTVVPQVVLPGSNPNAANPNVPPTTPPAAPPPSVQTLPPPVLLPSPPPSSTGAPKTPPPPPKPSANNALPPPTPMK